MIHSSKYQVLFTTKITYKWKGSIHVRPNIGNKNAEKESRKTHEATTMNNKYATMYIHYTWLYISYIPDKGNKNAEKESRWSCVGEDTLQNVYNIHQVGTRKRHPLGRLYVYIYGCICTIQVVNLEMPEGMTPFLCVARDANQVLSGEEIH